MIYIKYFAKYREWMGLAQEELDAEPESLLQLQQLLQEKRANFLKIKNDPLCLMAVNQQLVHSEDVVLRPGDEVAFYPPVTGG